jgi:enoyl-CoA hydratase
MPEDVLLVRRHGRVTVATLNRPAKANAISNDMMAALGRLATDLEAATARPDGPRALVIAGAGGKVFSAGADINDLVGLDFAAAREQMRRGQDIFEQIASLPIAVIAAVAGPALGGGLELAMAADIRIAGHRARFAQPEISLQNVPGWGGTQWLPRLIGRGLATEMILTGEPIDAERAQDLGLVNRVVDDPLADAIDLADRIATRSAAAIAGAKCAIAAGLAGGMAAGLQVEADAVARCCGTDEQHAAVRAFLDRKEKRG